MLFYFLLISIILFFSYKKPIYALVLILNINSLRAIPELDLDNLRFRGLNDPNLFISVLLPFAAYIIILFKIDFVKKKILYLFDITDLFFLSSIIVMTIYSFIAPNILEGIEFTLKYLFIGLPFYYITKIILYNSENAEIEYIKFFKATILVALFIGSLGLYLAYSVNFLEPSLGLENKVPIARMSISGVHPIPYSQAIGFGALIAFSVFYTKGITMGLTQRKHVIFVIFVFLYLFVLVLLANTRGVLISLLLAIFLFIRMSPIRMSKKVKRVLWASLILGILVGSYFLDFSSVFRRILQLFNNDASVSERMIILKEAFSVVFTNPIGVGTSGFIYSYPHNIFLDYIVSFGVFGWMLSLALVVIIIYFYMITFRWKSKYPVLVLLYCILIYFFTETLISFTLWMHKGLYLSIAMFVVYLRLVKKNESRLNLIE